MNLWSYKSWLFTTLEVDNIPDVDDYNWMNELFVDGICLPDCLRRLWNIFSGFATLIDFYYTRQDLLWSRMFVGSFIGSLVGSVWSVWYLEKAKFDFHEIWRYVASQKWDMTKIWKVKVKGQGKSSRSKRANRNISV